MPAAAQGGGGGAQRGGPLGPAAGAPLAGAAARDRDRLGGLGRARAPGDRDDPVRVSGVGRLEPGRRPAIAADQHRNLDRQLPVERGQCRQHRLARVGTAQLERRLVAKARPLHGAASSSSTGAPPWCARRKESLEVFSSSRRTRYAIPATRSPTGQ